jgi:hypothetical protein
MKEKQIIEIVDMLINFTEKIEYEFCTDICEVPECYLYNSLKKYKKLVEQNEKNKGN